MVGNYRLVAHASNYGYLQVRSDESVPLWHAEAAGVHPGSAGVHQYGLGWGACGRPRAGLCPSERAARCV